MTSIRSYVLAFGMVGVFVACSHEERMPREWGPLAKGKGDECPRVAGRYLDSSAPITQMLAARFVEVRDGDAEWDSFELAAPTATGLDVTVRYANGEERRGRARRGGPYDGDFYCADGWLQVGDRYMPNRWDDEGRSPGFVPRRRGLRIAPGTDGALVARLDLTGYDEFTVWCGDGCKGIPLPWTFETRSSWSAAHRWSPGAPRAHASTQGGASAPAGAAPASALDDRLAREEAALENGTPVAGVGEVRARGLGALVPGMQLKAVAPRDSGWQLSLEFDDLPQLQSYMVRLSQEGPVAEIRVAPLYRAKTPAGRWIDVVYVRYEQAK